MRGDTKATFIQSPYASPNKLVSPLNISRSGSPPNKYQVSTSGYKINDTQEIYQRVGGKLIKKASPHPKTNIKTNPPVSTFPLNTPSPQHIHRQQTVPKFNTVLSKSPTFTPQRKNVQPQISSYKQIGYTAGSGMNSLSNAQSVQVRIPQYNFGNR